MRFLRPGYEIKNLKFGILGVLYFVSKLDINGFDNKNIKFDTGLVNCLS